MSDPRWTINDGHGCLVDPLDGQHMNVIEFGLSIRSYEALVQCVRDADTLPGLVACLHRYQNGWYPTAHSAGRYVWCKDHYPNDGYVTEEITPAEQAALDLLTQDDT